MLIYKLDVCRIYFDLSQAFGLLSLSILNFILVVLRQANLDGLDELLILTICNAFLLDKVLDVVYFGFSLSLRCLRSILK